MKKHTLLIIILVFSTNSLVAQWSKGNKNGYYKLSVWYLQSNQHYTDKGVIDPNVTRTQFNTNIYTEYGIGKKTDLIAYIPFFAVTSQNNQISDTTGGFISKGESVESFGDVDLGVNYSLYKKGNWAVSVKLLLGLPTGNSNGGSDGSFQTGDGEFNQYLSTYSGYSTTIGGLPFYAKSYLGYNNRTKGFSDEFRTGLEAGISFFNSKLWVISRLNVVKSLKNGTLNAVNSNGSIFANNLEYSSFGLEIACYITNTIGVSVNLDTAFEGKIIAANPSFSGGIFLDIK